MGVSGPSLLIESTDSSMYRELSVTKPIIDNSLYTLFTMQPGTNKYDTIHSPIWQCTCWTVYNIVQSENTTGL